MRLSFYVTLSLMSFLLLFTSCKKSPTESNQTTQPAVENIPPAPSNLELVSLTESQVILRWKDNSTSETSFDIEVGTDTLLFTFLKSVDPNVDSAAVSGIFSTENFYYFRVRAKNTKSSSLSNIVGKTMFPSPSNFSLQSMSLSSVSLS